jgi:hypothetical protein
MGAAAPTKKKAAPVEAPLEKNAEVVTSFFN